MDTFNALRLEAEQKRDRAIAIARKDFADTLAQIDSVEQSLRQPRGSKRRSLILAVRNAMPRDSEFTLDELLGRMRADAPGRQFKTASVRTTLHRLCAEGVARRTLKGGGRRGARFVAEECDCPAYEFEAMSQIEVAELILREADRPMAMVEIVLEMRDRGFRSDASERAMLASIAASMRNSPGRFVKMGEKWAAV